MRWDRLVREAILADSELWRCLLVQDDHAPLVEQKALELVSCFVDPGILREQAQADRSTAGEYFLEHFIADNQGVRSGDLGEITTKLVLENCRDQPIFPGYRWRSKQHKDQTVQGFDLIGYLYADEDSPSQDDVLVLCEVKTRSSTVDRDVALQAYSDLKKHYISKLANYLAYYRAWLRQNGFESEADKLDRFSNPHELKFTKRLVPAVVHEESTWMDEFLDVLPQNHDGSEDLVFALIAVENLRDLFNEFCSQACERLNDG